MPKTKEGTGKYAIGTPIKFTSCFPQTYGLNVVQFPKRFVISILEYRTMDRLRKPSNSEFLSQRQNPLKSTISFSLTPLYLR
jgi:hypothetical protein